MPAQLPGPLVDAHLHVWADDPAAYPWSPINGASPPDLPGSADHVLAAAARSGMGVAVAVQPRAYGYDHRYLLDAVVRHPGRLVAVGAVDPLDAAGSEALQALAVAGVRGLRLDPLGHPGAWLGDGTVLPLWDAAARLGLPIELLTGLEPLPSVARLAARTPDLPVIVEHMAVFGAPPDADLRPLLDLARLPNVRVKISALASISAEPPPHRDLWPLARRVVEAYGPERCMWGSDMPWIGADAYVAERGTIEALPFLDAVARAWLLGGAARAAFGPAKRATALARPSPATNPEGGADDP